MPLTAQLAREKALDMGFDLVGFAPIGPTPNAQAFVDWLAQGRHGEMGYLAREPHKRLDLRQILSSAQTIIMVGVSYETLAVPHDILQDPSRGRIARYAWGVDYHDLITPRLREYGEWVAKESRAYVDTGPILERAWAEQCGLGFIGKNPCLIHRDRGSFFFLGAVLVNEELRLESGEVEIGDRRVGTEAESISNLKLSNLQSPESSPKGRRSLCGCGNCTRCLTACPTQAFPAPGVLDARRCISYLTIELKGSIPIELRPHMSNWIFGCDICQDVCPYVRRYSVATQSVLGKAFYPVDVDRAAPRLMDVLRLDRTAFNARYKGTPLLRAKRRGLLRNACVAAANWGDSEALPALERLLQDEEPLIREHAAWATEALASA